MQTLSRAPTSDKFENWYKGLASSDTKLFETNWSILKNINRLESNVNRLGSIKPSNWVVYEYELSRPKRSKDIANKIKRFSSGLVWLDLISPVDEVQ